MDEVTQDKEEQAEKPHALNDAAILNQTRSTCYRCGRHGGTMRLLCQYCREEDDAARNRLKESLYIETNPATTPFAFRLTQRPLLQGMLVVALFFFVMAFNITLPDFANEKLQSIAVRSLNVTSAFIVVLTWIFFWITLLVIEPIWALAALLLPFLVYKFVIMRWAEVRYIFVWNLAGIVIWLASYVVYDNMYAQFRGPIPHESPWAPFNRPSNPNFSMPELPDDTLFSDAGG